MTPSRQNAGWAVLDQVASSGTNALIPLIAIARTSTNDAGRLSVMLAAMFLALGISRGIVGEPYIVYASRADELSTARLRQSMLGLAVLVGTPIGAAVTLVAAVYMSAGMASIAIGLGFIGVLVQDAARFAMFEQEASKGAAINDLLWLVTFSVVALGFLDQPTGVTLLTSWCFTGAIAGAAAVMRLGALPRPAHAVGLLRGQSSTIWRVSGEYIVTAGVAQLLFMIVGVVGTLEASAAFRLAVTLLMPAGVLATGMAAGIQSMVMRAGHARRLRLVGSVWLASSLAIVVCMIVVLASPASFGFRVFGATFDRARPLVAVYAVGSVAAAGAAAIGMGIRATNRIGRALAVRSGIGVFTVLVALAVADNPTAQPVMIVMATASWLTLGGFVMIYRCSVSD